MLSATRMVLVWLVAALYESAGGVVPAAVAAEGGVGGEDADLDYYYKRVYDFGLGKRAAPAPYNFGLGKRAYTYSANKRPQYDFGIGKRDPSGQPRGQKLYAFGLGKRDVATFDTDLSYESPDISDQSLLGPVDYEKRIKPYEFGLGKRAAPAPYNFGLGKRQPGPNGKLYSFGLGKRYGNDYGISQRSQRYNFGIGKRDVNDDLDRFFASLEQDQEENEEDVERERPHNIATRASQKYNFGLGKRDSLPAYYYDDLPNDNSKRASRYNFGLGKRIPHAHSTRTLTAAYDDQLLDQLQLDHHNLYPRASQKFNFGLGKREVSKEDLDQLEVEGEGEVATGTAAKSPTTADLATETAAMLQQSRPGDYSRSRAAHVASPNILLKQQ